MTPENFPLERAVRATCDAFATDSLARVRSLSIKRIFRLPRASGITMTRSLRLISIPTNRLASS
jgi:hypothetical protein